MLSARDERPLQFSMILVLQKPDRKLSLDWRELEATRVLRVVNK